MLQAAQQEQKKLMDNMLKKNAKKSPLHNMKWHRIVLDEAHTIKDKSSQTAKAVFALESDRRWALSGTPLQNRVGELFSLIRFMRVDPYAYYFNKWMTCKQLNIDFVSQKNCEHCGRHRIAHHCWWNKHIMNPIKNFGFSGKGRMAMLRLKHEVLDKILLRRTKEGRSADILLPPKTIVLRKDRLDKYEEDFYQSLYTQSQVQFNAYVSSGTLLNNYAHIFDLLIRLRQAVNHPYLVQFSERNYMEGAGGGAGGGGLCGICRESLENKVSADCGHMFCKLCIEEYIETAPADDIKCPHQGCEKGLTVDLTKEAAEQKEPAKSLKRAPPIMQRMLDVEEFRSSTKIEGLMEELEMLAESDPCAKVIRTRLNPSQSNMLDSEQPLGKYFPLNQDSPSLPCGLQVTNLLPRSLPLERFFHIHIR